ncbi:FkbM family methyltransferase [Camelimonas fluminis]|uniref:FkbM family methyltransferase n=1 Tax=Camelimonas fluminis TaxID=1576911 RepID=A0ABV7UPK8_9HYPH|nr:FkbM family methyltransferase [Camelimonas fluminis]
MGSFKSAVIGLEKTPLSPVLSAAATVALTAIRREKTLIYKDKDGDWVNNQENATLYSRNYSTIRFSEVEAGIQDIWCHGGKIRHGDTVIDIGAGVGDDAVVLSRMVGPTGRVIAVEAHPGTFRCLSKTCAANNLSNVTPLNVAISDSQGELLVEDGENHLANRVGSTGNTSVRAITLDYLIETLGLWSVSVIKMNIEGAEVAALRGGCAAVGIAERWVISCHDFMAHIPGYENSATWSDVVETLSSAGLSILPQRRDARPWVPYYVYASRNY